MQAGCRSRAALRHAPSTQRQHGAQLRHRAELRRQETVARADLERRRQVLGRHAAHRIADAAVEQPEPVPRVGAVAPLRETEIQQRPVQQLAGEVPGEGPPGAVGAAHARRQAEHQQPRIQAAEARHRRIVPAGWPARLACRYAAKPGRAGSQPGRGHASGSCVQLTQRRADRGTARRGRRSGTVRPRGSIWRRVNSGAISASSRN